MTLTSRGPRAPTRRLSTASPPHPRGGQRSRGVTGSVSVSAVAPQEGPVPTFFVRDWDCGLALRGAVLLAVGGVVVRSMLLSIGEFLTRGQGQNTVKPFKFERDPSVTTRFADVAGATEAKVEIMEIVDFLKNPQKYTRVGAKIPRGALLVGPPGVGKTLLARATAGEAGVHFFNLSGSDFVEMYVGVGASRVRQLFKEAREAAPCIIFIDEIDAVGRKRSDNKAGGGRNDEREATLNSLLVEMDGFSAPNCPDLVVLAGTNRPDVLDNALKRPGRFDRLISLPLPNLEDRVAIFKVHLRNLTVDRSVAADGSLESAMEFFARNLAALTPGFSGADIMNVCNGGALIAARGGNVPLKPADTSSDALSEEGGNSAAEDTAPVGDPSVNTSDVTQASSIEVKAEDAGTSTETPLAEPTPAGPSSGEASCIRYKDFTDAIERVMIGIKKENKVLSASEKRIVAYRLAGQALFAWKSCFMDHVLKVSILPRSAGRVGFMQFFQRERYIKVRKFLEEQLAFHLASRVVENDILGTYTTAAADDVRKGTKLARSIVCEYGMEIDTVGHVNFMENDNRYTHPFSEATEYIIDTAVSRLMADAQTRATEVLTTYQADVHRLAQELMAAESLDYHVIKRILGARPDDLDAECRKDEPVEPATVGSGGSAPPVASPPSE